jgi:malate synthase
MNSINTAYLLESLRIDKRRANSDDTLLGLLDSHFPLTSGSHGEVTQYRVYFNCLLAHLNSGQCVGLSDPGRFIDYGGDKESPTSILLGYELNQIELTL